MFCLTIYVSRTQLRDQTNKNNSTQYWIRMFAHFFFFLLKAVAYRGSESDRTVVIPVLTPPVTQKTCLVLKRVELAFDLQNKTKRKTKLVARIASHSK